MTEQTNDHIEKAAIKLAAKLAKIDARFKPRMESTIEKLNALRGELEQARERLIETNSAAVVERALVLEEQAQEGGTETDG